MNKLLVLITSVMLTTSAFAMSGSYGISSDYMWRGQTQTDHGPAVNFGLEQTLGKGFYAGVWGSNVDINGEQEVEADFYGGYSMAKGNFGLDLGYVSYKYSGEGDNDFNEKYVSMSYRMITIGKAMGVGDALDYEFVDLTLPFGDFADVTLHYGDYETVIDKSISIDYSLSDSMTLGVMIMDNVRNDGVSLGDAVSVHFNSKF